MCGMYGFKNSKHVGDYPLTKVQFEKCCKLTAQLCLKYKIKVNEYTVFTHYEFGLRNPNSTSAGKIDITFLPPYDWVTKKEIGNFIRSKVRWYMEKL